MTVLKDLDVNQNHSGDERIDMHNEFDSLKVNEYREG